MGPALLHAALSQDENAAGVLDGGQPVGNHNYGPALRKPFKGPLDQSLVLRVRKGCRFVQNQDGRIFQHDTGDGDALLFAPGEIHAFCADHRVDALGQLGNDVIALGLMEYPLYLLAGSVGLGKADIFQNGGFQQAAVLEYIGHGVHQRLLGNILHIDTADLDGTASHIPKPGDQAGHSGLAAPGGAYQSHSLACAHPNGHITERVRCSACVAEGHIFQDNVVVRGDLAAAGFGQRLHIQNGVDTAHGVRNNHAVFAHKHHLRHGRGNEGREDHIEDEVQQHRLGHRPTARQNQRQYNQEREGAVDQDRIGQHGRAALLAVGHDKLVIAVDGPLKSLEGVDGLPEGFHNRNAPHILHRLVVHIRQGVLVELHVLRHGRSGHFEHSRKAQDYRQEADKAKPPVKQKQHDDHAHRRGDRRRHIGKLVGQIGFGGRAAVADDAANFSAACLPDETQGQLGNMGHQRLADISGDTEGRQVGTHQSADIDHDGQHRKSHRHPAVADDVRGLCVVGGHRNDLLDDSEQENEGEKCQDRTDGGQQQG